MTGICGWLGDFGAGQSPSRLIERMTDSLGRFGPGQGRSHHGDDDWGIAVACQERYGDLFHGPAGTAAIYGQVRTDSAALDAAIQRIGPAQAVLEAYVEQGADFLSSISGRFVLAAMQPSERRVVLATDGLGSIPMTYALGNGGVAFASNVRVFRESGLLELEPDPQAIFQYLYFHVVPSPHSIYRGVAKLPPGHRLEVVAGRSSCESHKTLKFNDDLQSETIDSLESGFRDALRAGVASAAGDAERVGCFLSGGLDSSTVAGMLGPATGRKARTYSIGFDEEGYDELEYARCAAEHFDTDHHEYYVTQEDVADFLPRISEIYGEPYGNSSAVPTYYCASMAAKDGVELLLGGDGGDELFGGNARYAKQLIYALYDRLPSVVANSLVKPVAETLPMGWTPTRKVRRYVEQASQEMPRRMFTYNHYQMLGGPEILEPSFLSNIDLHGPMHDLSSTYHGASASTMIDRMLALDIKYTLADNDLPKVTTMCELAGVETRFPFLEDAVVDFARRLPANQKVRRSKLRVIFRNALRDFLPDEVLTKKKHGFGLPFGIWLSTDENLKAIAHDALAGLSGRGVVKPDFIANLMNEQLTTHPQYYGGYVWVLMLLELWFRQDDSARLRNEKQSF